MTYMNTLTTNERGRPPQGGSPSSFGAWIKDQRTKRGWSSERMSEELGLSQGAISLYERGARRPKREKAVQIAIVLGVDPQEALRALVADTPGLEGLPEPERIPDEEYLQESIMAYSGPNPILNAAAATARSMKELFDKAGPALTGDEPTEVLVYGRGPRKGITKVDGK